MSPAELSFEEVQRMRQIVQQFDAERQPMTTTDLNNPPKEPYRFQKFPMMVYSEGETLTVRSEEELAAAIDDGWSQQAPIVLKKREEALSATLQAEAAQTQKRIDELNTRKRRRTEPTEAA